MKCRLSGLENHLSHKVYQISPTLQPPIQKRKFADMTIKKRLRKLKMTKQPIWTTWWNYIYCFSLSQKWSKYKRPTARSETNCVDQMSQTKIRMAKWPVRRTRRPKTMGSCRLQQRIRVTGESSINPSPTAISISVGVEGLTKSLTMTISLLMMTTMISWT